MSFRGLAWANDSVVTLAPDKVGAKVLCKRHNELTSPLDDEFKLFFNGVVGIPLERPVDGALVERWMLKTLLSGVIGNQLAFGDGHDRPTGADPRAVAVVLGFSPLPATWGMYAVGPDLSRYPPSEHDIAELNDPAEAIVSLSACHGDNQSVGLKVEIGGSSYFLAMGPIVDFDRFLPSFRALRPGRLTFQGALSTHVVEFNWGDAEPGRGVVVMPIGPTRQVRMPRHAPKRGGKKRRPS